MDLRELGQTLQDLDPVVWIAVGVVAALIVAAVVALVVRRRRRRALKDRYGGEYERTAREAGSRRRADRELVEREERRQTFEVRDLDTEERDLVRSRWEALQASFVDSPETAVRGAEDLIDEVATTRGYPDAGTRQRLADLATDHPGAVDRYRRAQVVRGSDEERPPSTEALREAMLGARDLFEALVGREPLDTSTAPPPFRNLVGEEPERIDVTDDDGSPDPPADTGRQGALTPPPPHEERGRSDPGAWHARS